MSIETRFNPETATVHEAIQSLPGAFELFRRHGIDACCGGDLPVAEAARRHGIDLATLLAELERAEPGDEG